MSFSSPMWSLSFYLLCPLSFRAEAKQSHQKCSTHRSPQHSGGNWYFAVMLIVHSTVFAASDTVFSLELGVFRPASAVIRPSTHLVLLRHSLFGYFFLSLRPLMQASGSCLAFGAPWSFAMPPFLGKVE